MDSIEIPQKGDSEAGELYRPRMVALGVEEALLLALYDTRALPGTSSFFLSSSSSSSSFLRSPPSLQVADSRFPTAFEHPFFQRNRPDLLPLILRRGSSPALTPSQPPRADEDSEGGDEDSEGEEGGRAAAAFPRGGVRSGRGQSKAAAKEEEMVGKEEEEDDEYDEDDDVDDDVDDENDDVDENDDEDDDDDAEEEAKEKPRRHAAQGGWGDEGEGSSSEGGAGGWSSGRSGRSRDGRPTAAAANGTSSRLQQEELAKLTMAARTAALKQHRPRAPPTAHQLCAAAAAGGRGDGEAKAGQEASVYEIAAFLRGENRRLRADVGALRAKVAAGEASQAALRSEVQALHQALSHEHLQVVSFAAAALVKRQSQGAAERGASAGRKPRR